MANIELDSKNCSRKILHNVIDKLSKPAILLNKDYVILAMNRPTLLLHNIEEAPVGENYAAICKKLSIKSPLEKYHKTSQTPFYSSVNYNAAIVEWEIIKLVDEESNESLYYLVGENISQVFKLQKIINDSLAHLENITTHVIRRDIKVNNPERLMEYIDAIVFHYDRIIASLPGLIYWKDLTLHYGGANDNVAKVVGFRYGKDLVGKNDEDLRQNLGLPKSVIEDFIKDDKKVVQTEKPILGKEEKPFKGASGEEVFELSNRVPLYDKESKLVGILCNTVDVTNLKKTQAQLLRAKEKAEEFNKLKSKFIENMEHDLRTPLSGLEATISGLLTNKGEGVEKQTLEFSLSSVEELKVIINSILDFENKKYGYKVLNEPFKLSQVFESIYRLYHPTANSKNLKLSYKIDSTLPCVLISDEWRIKHILINLVGNALKFTNEGEVSFEAKLIRHDDRKVLIEFVVKDTGIGIPDDKRKVIFERYVRLEGSNKGRYKGTGLGLANVKDYVDQLGGEFRPIESELNKGTTFTILISMKESLDQAMPLPSDQEKAKKDDIEFFYDIAKKPKKLEPIKATKSKVTSTQKTQASEKPQATPTPTEKTSVLLVEDSLVAQHMAKTVIVGLDCNVDVAGSAEDALKMIAEKDYDLIFADIGLPRMDGIEMTRHIRYNERKAGKRPTPIIGQTANANAKNKKSGLEAGMQDLFPKPLNTKIVTDMLQNYTDQGAQSTPAAFVPPAIKNKHVIDWYIFKSIWQDKARARDVFQDSRLDTFGTIEEFKMAYKAKDWKQLVFLAHKMRGAFIYFGCTRLEEAFSHLEDYLNETKKPDPKIIKSLYDTVLIELRSALDEIEKL